MPFGPRLKAIQHRLADGKAGRVSGRDLPPGIKFLQSSWTLNNVFAKLSKATSVKPSLITMQDFSKLSPTPKIRNLSTGFVLLTVGPYQETVEPHEIQEVTQILQNRYNTHFLPDSQNCYILTNRKNFLECLHTEAQKLKQ